MRFSKRSKKRVIRYSLLTANLALLGLVTTFVVGTPPSSQANKQSAVITVSEDVGANPLDQLSSADIAVHIARMAYLPEAVAVTNQADSFNAQLAGAQLDNTLVTKVQIVNTATKSRHDIVRYKTKSGDTLASIANEYGVTSDSIRWSNGLTNGYIEAGKELLIPPINGIIHVVKADDTPASLAREYNTNKDSIISFNDAEVSGLPVGERIVIPDGTKSAPMYVATGSYGGGGYAWGSSAVYGYNGYDYGWCTWYVASKISMPANWGNASTWDNYAPGSGWTVSSVPRPGAIAQTDYAYYGLGHVAIVEAVSEDGTMIKYSDMNGLAGWGNVGYSDWVPAKGKFQNYIYR